MRSLTTEQMREADRRCIEELGIPGAVLMNNAGTAVFREIPGGPVGIVCGKGNNGGDGFVVARLSLVAGFRTRVILVGEASDVKGDARLFLDAYHRLGGEVDSISDPDSAARAVASLAGCAYLVDALLGTGFRGEVRGAVRAAIEAWPDIATVAVDVPSGLDADTGDTAGPCIRADATVTFQFAKRGFDNPNAQPYLGRLVVADIGIPPVCADDESWERLRKSPAWTTRDVP
ncbi:MAG: NAD(P)H-hydrate epimerase [FCB group bacterium]|jgi:NAD(P)H-hydrate epimerase|nr:NAD(P)H-hydrate epimerase [FCB group bacterium]